MIDAGGDVPRIAEAITKQGLDVRALWLTHGHLDHAGGVMDLRDILNARSDQRRWRSSGPDTRDAVLLENLQRAGRALRLDRTAQCDARPLADRGRAGGRGRHVFECCIAPAIRRAMWSSSTAS